MTRGSERAAAAPMQTADDLSHRTCMAARRDMSSRPGAITTAWALLAALATGCCATQPTGGETPSVGGSNDPGHGGHGGEHGGEHGGDHGGDHGGGDGGGDGPRPTLPGAQVEFAVIDADEVRRRLWPEPGPPAYVAPDERQSAALSTLVRGMLTDPIAPRAELAQAASAAGYTLEGWSVAGRRYLAAVEQPNRRGGGGAYVVRVPTGEAPVGAVILQAPHGFYDLGTETIALEMLLSEGDWPRALFVNTMHRYLGADGVRRKRANSPADPCHSDTHLLAVATAAAVAAQPRVEVIQLHGFGDASGDKEDGATGPQPAAIVSAGLPDAPTVRSRLIAARLRDALGVEVALFPVDTDRLGATTNVQGRVIHAHTRTNGPGAEFIHIEMSASLRQWLRNDPAARALLATALRRDPPGTP